MYCRMNSLQVFSSCLWLWILGSALVKAFSPDLVRSSSKGVSPRRYRHHRCSSGHKLRLSTRPENTMVVKSLETLLARQREELQETERLLEQIQQPLTIPTESTSRIARSFLKGFDYGFKSRSEGSPSPVMQASVTVPGYDGPPANVWALGTQQFMRNLRAMWGEYREEEDCTLTDEQEAMQYKLEQLTLNSTATWERELAYGPIEAQIIIKVPYLVLHYFLDYVFDGRYVPARFFFLETVARMPYFSYIAMLHLYETLGFWRRSADMKRIHFTEELNAFRHLLIMESLGGDQMWWTRFLAQHCAIAYFIMLSMHFLISPSLSYRFSELLEKHAVNTYGQLLDENAELLKELPPSAAAIDYYSLGSWDPFYAEFQTRSLEEGTPTRRPGESMSSLYNVFSAIRSDEADHVHTMGACLDPKSNIRSISLEKRVMLGFAVAAAAGAALTSVSPDGTELSGNLNQIFDSLTGSLEGEATSGSIVDAVVLGAGGLLQQVVGASEEDGGNAAAAANELAETGGSLPVLAEALWEAASNVVGVVARFIATIL